ncbi:MAG TPA: alpha-hydroxy-acid oxidizing protein [Pseudomonas xinjiangensis]|uniref:Alpha-hydroxy-acid oxidizing protein n=2 Tax=root TaxID=1 RepID=A0A7V1FU88_9GAMM|nr:alpha-hydroxy-acid oxidizing protein [Halopseudomonas xinjiangensis]HEC46338.1 alpha-hydroxy-acid oxidizing protein [Halopseudomonas xinjiangensis]
MTDGLPPLQRIPPDVVALDDYAGLCRQHMSEAACAWLNGGAADELTLRDNRAAFERIKLNTRVLQQMQGGHTELTLFGQRLAYPILLAPVAHQRLVHPDGELATLLGASAMGAAMVVSTQASVVLEDIASAAHAPLWFQLYMQADRAFTETLVRRAEAAGYQALVLTVDAPVTGVRNREQRSGFVMPSAVEAVNLAGSAPLPAHTARAGTSPLFGSPLVATAPSWEDLDWLRLQTRLPILLKGVLNPEDVRQALARGVDGIIVSNHGGRVLDGVPATIDALPAVVRAVDSAVPIFLDGGIRRGTDILKALALGAKAVLVGRPYVQALAAGGPAGVAHVLHILRTELEMAMILTGCRTLADIDHRVIWQGPEDNH